MQLILASSSKSRIKQLEQLKLPFAIYPPEIDESRLKNESPEDMVIRLARLKAMKASNEFTKAVIIAGDQVHVVADQVHGKPLNFETALKQLLLAQGSKTEFLSGIAVLNNTSGKLIVRLVRTEVTFHKLDEYAIKKYLEIDKPYECAGSIRIEGLAPCLIESISTNDPTAITGMPLITCCEMLSAVGYNCLTHANSNYQA